MDYKEIIKTKTILLVDNDKDFTQTIGGILEMITRSVIVAKNGKEAFKMYKEYKPDIILSDINLPVISGLEFMQKVREIDNTIPIVVLTSHTDTSYLLEAVKLMLTDYVLKPIEIKKLVDVLHRCCKYLSSQTQIKLKNGSFYNLQTKELSRNNNVVSLGAKEVNLLHTLISNPNKTFSQSEIANSVWHNNYVSEGALKTIISKIRNKIGKENIKTIKGMGYKIELYDNF